MLTIKAHKIDVFTQTIYSVAIQPEELEDYYQVMGTKAIASAFYLPNGDCFIVDDSDIRQFPKSSFKFEHYHRPIYGNALIIGTDALTDFTVPPSTPLDQLRSRIQFLSLPAPFSLSNQ